MSATKRVLSFNSVTDFSVPDDSSDKVESTKRNAKVDEDELQDRAVKTAKKKKLPMLVRVVKRGIWLGIPTV